MTSTLEAKMQSLMVQLKETITLATAENEFGLSIAIATFSQTLLQSFPLAFAPTLSTEEKSSITRGYFLDAIKAVRSRRNLSLKDAKELCEKFRDTGAC